MRSMVEGAAPPPALEDMYLFGTCPRPPAPPPCPLIPEKTGPVRDRHRGVCPEGRSSTHPSFRKGPPRRSHGRQRAGRARSVKDSASRCRAAAGRRPVLDRPDPSGEDSA